MTIAGLIVGFLGAGALFLAIGFGGVLINATTLVWDTITYIPEYLTQFMMLSHIMIPSWIMSIILTILGIALAYMIVKIFQHLISAVI